MTSRGYGVFDLGFATLYGWLGFGLAPSRSPAFQVALGTVAAMLFVTGAVLVAGRDRGGVGRWLGIATSLVLLAFTLVVIVLLAVSAAFLHGVYGAVGHALSALALVAAALTVELCGLLPLFQLRHHLRASR